MKIKIFISLVLLASIVFYKYGRSLYMPLVKKIIGKETLESIEKSIESDVWNRLKINLAAVGYDKGYPSEIIILAFKEEQKLQIYSKDSIGIKLIKTYPFTSYSGKLGPKLKEGDKQIPEGIYEVEYLNPNSSYYLSIKINYPNSFDRSKSKYTDHSKMGGDIFIHGKSATIGCIPIGDEAIEEVFLLTKNALRNKVKVIISPRDFRLNMQYPEIREIDWDKELYDIINTELRAFKKQGE